MWIIWNFFPRIKKLETSIQNIKIFSQARGPEVKNMQRSVKRKTIERLEMSNEKSVRSFGENENNNYLGILEEETTKQTETTEKERNMTEKQETRHIW